MKMPYRRSASHFRGCCRSIIALLSVVILLAAALPPTQAEHSSQKSPKGLTEEQRVLHILNRLAFGARPGDIERVRSSGIDKYIEQQLHPSQIDDALVASKIERLITLSLTTAELYTRFPQPAQVMRELQRQGIIPSNSDEMNSNAANINNEKYRRAVRDYYQKNGLLPPRRILADLQASRILRAVYSERQLQEVMVDFWSNHFNIFAGKGVERWLLTSYDRDTIRPNALGKFSDLLVATAKSPAMLFYLDNFQSVSPNLSDRRPPRPRDLQFSNGRPNPIFDGRRMDEQRMQMQQPISPQRARRGLNENYARELMELHTLGVDGGYTQKDVQEVARCFTGWTIFAPRGGGVLMGGVGSDEARRNAGSFFFNSRVHDNGEKSVLGHKIPADGGIKDGYMVLEILANHPSTARFIATKLVRHFVMDDPPLSLVERVVTAYRKSGGDIRELLRTIFFSPEFNSPAAYRAKVKRPFELVVSAIRTVGAETNGGPPLQEWLARMGEPLYGFQAPTGYSDAAENWVNTGGLLERMNFGLALANNSVPGTRVDITRLVDGSIKPSGKQSELVDQLLAVVLAEGVSLNTRTALIAQLNEGVAKKRSPEVDQDRLSRSRILGLILGSPEFQRQ